MKIPVVRLDPLLPLPAHARAGDAGVDLHAREAGVLEPGERAMVPTGIAVAIPPGHVGLVAPRSGLAVRHGISVVNGPGVIDSGYRGELHVVLVNLGREPWVYERGDRVGQLVVVPYAPQEWHEVDELPASDRGPEGFGSTGN
jgi:dUTP pyrophosphatase